MSSAERTKKPYNDRTDLEKLQSQWNKIRGIFEREKEWSAAIVRAATATEIAANIAIRKRFEADSTFSTDFVDSLLYWANGLDGKFKRLIVPSETDDVRQGTLNRMINDVQTLNKRRNEIVHRGSFSSEKEAKEFIRLARKIALELVKPWEPDFKLKMSWRSRKKAQD